MPSGRRLRVCCRSIRRRGPGSPGGVSTSARPAGAAGQVAAANALRVKFQNGKSFFALILRYFERGFVPILPPNPAGPNAVGFRRGDRIFLLLVDKSIFYFRQFVYSASYQPFCNVNITRCIGCETMWAVELSGFKCLMGDVWPVCIK